METTGTEENNQLEDTYRRRGSIGKVRAFCSGPGFHKFPPSYKDSCFMTQIF